MHVPKPAEGGDFTPAPAGTFTATCYRFIDLGTHINDFQGERKTRHEVMLSWEIADEFMEDGRPFTVNKRYTWSMHAKSTLRHHLEAWRGRAFTNDDFDGPNAFDTRNLLGKTCTITVTQETKQDDKVISKVASVGKAMKGIQPPPLHNAQKYLALTRDRFDPAVMSELGEYYQTLIKSSPEYKELFQRTKTDEPPPAAGYDGPDDDIPF